jgi:hypothetical protein
LQPAPVVDRKSFLILLSSLSIRLTLLHSFLRFSPLGLRLLYRPIWRYARLAMRLTERYCGLSWLSYCLLENKGVMRADVSI